MLSHLNPVTPLLVTARELLTGHALSHLPGFVMVCMLIGVILPMGIIFFRVTTSTVVERWSS